jgi:hypothetical protein
MNADQKFQVIHRTVSELVALEGELARRLERAEHFFSEYPDALAAMQRLRPMVQTHRNQLVGYLKESGGVERSGETASPKSASTDATDVSEVLRDLCLAFQHLALNYTILSEMAYRLYEPRLRQIAPGHLKAYADASLSTARLLPGIVAWQLAKGGLHCACICPLCGIGACGCVSWVTEAMANAWRDAAATEWEPHGFVLQPPKPGSEFARAGAQGGEIVLAVDGQQVRGRLEVYDAIDKHMLGDEMRILIQRSSETPREVIVRHVSDYSKS